MQLRVLYRFKKSIFSHSSVMKDIRLRTMACSASAKRSGNKTDLRSSSSVMAMSANKATRFVYLRTLPLVKQPELADEVDDIAKRIEACTKMLCEKHIDSVVDDRAAVHLHTASLAIATHRVLSAQIANEIRLTNIIRAGFGAALVPQTVGNDETIARQKASEKLRPDYWIIRAALWFSLDKMKSVRKMTANMVRDFGASFETSSRDTDTESQTEHKLIVSTYEASMSLRIQE